MRNEDEMPDFFIDLQSGQVHEIPEHVFHSGLEKRVHILNVAGPKGKNHPGTQEKVKAIVLGQFKFIINFSQ